MGMLGQKTIPLDQLLKKKENPCVHPIRPIYSHVQSIEAKDSVKSFGATIDQTLSFEPMARSVLSKVNGRLRFLFRKAEFLSSHIKNC